MLETQAANKALLHRIQGYILLYQLKGRTVNSFQQGRGKAQRSPGRVASNLCKWLRNTYRTLRNLRQTHCSAKTNSSAVSVQPCQGISLKGGVVCLGERCRIIYWTCTEHYGSFSFNLTTYLFSLLGQSPIIWQWEYRKMFRTIMYFWSISLLGFVNWE